MCRSLQRCRQPDGHPSYDSVPVHSLWCDCYPQGERLFDEEGTCGRIRSRRGTDARCVFQLAGYVNQHHDGRRNRQSDYAGDVQRSRRRASHRRNRRTVGRDRRRYLRQARRHGRDRARAGRRPGHPGASERRHPVRDWPALRHVPCRRTGPGHRDHQRLRGQPRLRQGRQRHRRARQLGHQRPRRPRRKARVGQQPRRRGRRHDHEGRRGRRWRPVDHPVRRGLVPRRPGSARGGQHRRRMGSRPVHVEDRGSRWAHRRPQLPGHHSRPDRPDEHHHAGQPGQRARHGRRLRGRHGRGVGLRGQQRGRRSRGTGQVPRDPRGCGGGHYAPDVHLDDQAGRHREAGGNLPVEFGVLDSTPNYDRILQTQ